MAIYIIGAGAIGQALAVMLKQSDREVILIRGSVDRQPATVQTIRVELPDGTLLTAEVPVQTLSDQKELDGPLVITSKSYGNEALAAKLTATGTTSPVVLLQNGLDIEQPFLDQQFRQVYRCVLMVTSQFRADGCIQFKPVNPCPVGVIRGDQPELQELVTQLQNPWFPFKTEAQIRPLVWKKVIANCVFNSICPLLDTDNGIFHRDENAMNIARRIIAECILVATGSGNNLDAAEVEQLVLAISRSSDGQLISTLQDIRQKRPTEIATLNLAVVRLAEQLQLAHLVTETRLLGELTALQSQLNR